ncbi:ninja-family protein 2-like [Gastrolobium bilobum]|uniref:ninja-family protein 2-like n=1 Tax=Gastrolobium bilobum TaxID=150636 RepID=UPI002AB277D0|nr:ninja-family protein 2-like [Gastrolobium bilobum]
MEVSAELGLGEEELELDLRLSIGGSFSRTDARSNGFQSERSNQESKRKRRLMMRESCDEAKQQQQRGIMSKREKTGGVSFNNGLVFPTACRGFQPFSIRDSEQNDERDVVDSSSICASSVVSEHQSSSRDGGGSTDRHDNSTHSSSETTQLSNSDKENSIRSQTEESALSHPVKCKHGKVEGRNHIVKEIQPKITPEPTKLKVVPICKPLSDENSSNDDPLKETKTEMGKAPKPLSQSSSLPRMPYVSTTGNGPNGKTVNGFLYRCTKSEVSIVCVCHGSTFSPTEFVQHAGGTDISQPLRHITVIPSAFG